MPSQYILPLTPSKGKPDSIRHNKRKKTMRIGKGKAGKAIKCLIKTGIKCRVNGRRKNGKYI